MRCGKTKAYHILEGDLEWVAPCQPLCREQRTHAEGLKPDDATQRELCEHGRNQHKDEHHQKILAFDREHGSDVSDQCCACDNTPNDGTGYYYPKGLKREKEKEARWFG